MVLSSIQVCMDSDWPQSVMHERTLKPLEEMLPACSRPMMEQSGLKPPPPDQPLKCPRCDSANTKFCYYNNYSLSQPRHFCKTCKRYWTRGCTLRNVPVGGGCRKNKRAKRTIDHACAQMNEASTSVNELNINGSAPLGHSHIANSMFYGLPAGSATARDGIHSLSLATRLADQRALYGNDSEFLRTFFDPRSCNLSPLNGLSSLNALNTFKPTFPGLNFNSNPNRTEALTRAVRDIDASFFESLPTQISEVPLPVLNSTNCDDLSPYSLSLQEGINNGNTNRYSEANQWRAIEQQKLAEGSDPVQVGLTPFSELENSNNSRNDLNLKVVTSLPSCVKVEGQDNRLNITPEWPVPSEPLFEAASDSAYWNGGVWPELTNYGSSVGSLI